MARDPHRRLTVLGDDRVTRQHGAQLLEGLQYLVRISAVPEGHTLIDGDSGSWGGTELCVILLDGEAVHQGEFRVVMASTLSRLFSRMRPFWGQGPGGVRFTSIAAPSKNSGRAALGLIRGKPADWVTPENGYTSRNVERAELRMNCGFTVDGELWQPDPDRSIELSAERVVHFVRA